MYLNILRKTVIFVFRINYKNKYTLMVYVTVAVIFFFNKLKTVKLIIENN